jgi:hypothetical protein
MDIHLYLRLQFYCICLNNRVPRASDIMQPRHLRLLIVFVTVVSLIGASFAVTKLSIANTTNINPGQNIAITQPSLTPPGSCPANGDPSYIQNPTSLFWNLTAGATGEIYYFCMNNQGTVSDPVSITASPTTVISSGVAGACAAGANTGNSLVMVVTAQTPLAAHSVTTTPDSVQVCAGTSMATGAGPSFTVDVQ